MRWIVDLFLLFLFLLALPNLTPVQALIGIVCLIVLISCLHVLLSTFDWMIHSKKGGDGYAL